MRKPIYAKMLSSIAHGMAEYQRLSLLASKGQHWQRRENWYFLEALKYRGLSEQASQSSFEADNGNGI